MRCYWFLVAILGAWRLTHLLQAEDGPWNLIVRLRHAAGDRFPGQLMDCFNCLSLWIAAPMAYFLGEGPLEQLLLWPAISGGAMLLQRATDRQLEAQPIHFEEEGVEHALLRRPQAESPAAETEGQVTAA